MNTAEKTRYHAIANTMICPYCNNLRTRDNIHQTRPRVRCKPCHAARQKRFNESLKRAKQ